MKIEILQTCKHGPATYTVGDITTVDEETGAALVAAGWAVRFGEIPPQGKKFKENVTLSIDNGRIGHAASNVGNG